MTIKDLVQGQPTLEQLRIFEVADRLLPGGRYHGGQLTAQTTTILLFKSEPRVR